MIRSLVANRGRRTLHEQKNVRVRFVVYELRDELQRVKHSYRSAEIVEATELLQEVRITIQDRDAKGSPLLQSAAFPEVGFRRRDDEEAETFDEFNSLVARANLRLTFQQVDCDTLMEVRDPVARWLLKRLHVQGASTRSPVQQLTANDIRRDSGLPEWKKSQDMCPADEGGRAAEEFVDVTANDAFRIRHQRELSGAA